MTKTFRAFTGSLLILMLAIAPTDAKVSPEEAAKLGQELTPMGAIRSGNAEGTIPAWEGGITQPPTGYEVGMHHPDPFADDQPLFTITAANLDKYREKLSPGQIAMFKRYPKTWKMTVYLTRRSASFPQEVYDATIANATTAELAPGGYGVVNAIRGVPFPIPTDGVEPTWNHLLRYRGQDAIQVMNQAVLTSSGRYTPVRIEQRLIWPYYRPGANYEDIRNRLAFFWQSVLGPARLAGFLLLAHEPINQVVEARKSWVYLPGLRRVRRAPNNAYDNPGTATDGQRFNDQNDMYNGSPDRYDWTLVGRKEMYVAYNSYKLHSDKVTYEEILTPGHLNPDLLRYELHRVWVSDANLKEGKRHQFHRRTFYLDEDSWQILAIDQYDSRKNIWRVSEVHPINYYEVPLLFETVGVHYDLQNGRYLAIGMNNQEPMVKFNNNLSPKDFTPEALRRKGRR